MAITLVIILWIVGAVLFCCGLCSAAARPMPRFQIRGPFLGGFANRAPDLMPRCLSVFWRN